MIFVPEEDTVKNLGLLVAAVALVMSAAMGSSAQTASLQRGNSSPRIIQGFGFGPAGMIISPKPQAPFSAVMVERMEETLSDGTNINRENEEAVMRDSVGRTYRARKIIRPAAAGERDTIPRMMVTISDPVQHVQYVCSPVKVCRKMGYRTWPNGRGPQRGPYPPLHPGKDGNVTVEELGTSDISGVQVVGRRVTRVFPEGTVGNDRPITSVEELWRSEELDVAMQVKRTDPRYGTRTTTLTQVSLGEPDASYFQIPEGYRVVEGMMPPAQPQVEPRTPNQ